MLDENESCSCSCLLLACLRFNRSAISHAPMMVAAIHGALCAVNSRKPITPIDFDDQQDQRDRQTHARTQPDRFTQPVERQITLAMSSAYTINGGTIKPAPYSSLI